MSGGTARCRRPGRDRCSPTGVSFARRAGGPRVQFDPGEPLTISVDIDVGSRGRAGRQIDLHASSSLGPHDIPIWQMETDGTRVASRARRAGLTVDFVVPQLPTLLGAFAVRVQRVRRLRPARRCGDRRFDDLFGIAGRAAGRACCRSHVRRRERCGSRVAAEPRRSRTVVIVNWNGAHLLPACLDAVAQLQTTPFAFETVGRRQRQPPTARVELLRTRYPDVRVIADRRQPRFRRRQQPGAARGDDAVRGAAEQRRGAGAGLAGEPARPVRRARRRTARRGHRQGRVPAALRPAAAVDPGLRARPARHAASSACASASVRRRTAPRQLGEVLWERLTYGAEGPPDGRFFWTRPDRRVARPRAADGAVDDHLRAGRPNAHKDVTLSWDGGSADAARRPSDGADVTLHAAGRRCRGSTSSTTPAASCSTEGYGADRGYQQVDDGQFDEPRRGLHRLRQRHGDAHRARPPSSAGSTTTSSSTTRTPTCPGGSAPAATTIRYEPTAVLRHLHAASSEEWSPLFVFHVDRNRLLMLTKDATAGAGAAGGGALPADHRVDGAADGPAGARRPAAGRRSGRPCCGCGSSASYLRLLPRMLSRRRAHRPDRRGRPPSGCRSAGCIDAGRDAQPLHRHPRRRPPRGRRMTGRGSRRLQPLLAFRRAAASGTPA